MNASTLANSSKWTTIWVTSTLVFSDRVASIAKVEGVSMQPTLNDFQRHQGSHRPTRAITSPGTLRSVCNEAADYCPQEPIDDENVGPLSELNLADVATTTATPLMDNKNDDDLIAEQLHARCSVRQATMSQSSVSQNKNKTNKNNRESESDHQSTAARWRSRWAQWCAQWQPAWLAHSNDRVLLDKWTVRDGDLNKLKVGDIVVAISPRDPQQRLIKRIIALPDQNVTTADGRQVHVPAGHCWIVGDNTRSVSFDSNIFGPIPLGLITARVLCVLWPPQRCHWLASR